MSHPFDHGPSLLLDKPLCITGFMGARVDATAKAIAALSGLPVLELDRQIEHDSGKSIAHLVLREGQDKRRLLERAALDKALSGRPRVIALGDGALLDPRSAVAVSQRARLVYLEWSIIELSAAVRERLAESPGRYPELPGADHISALGLQPLLQERLPGYLRADLSVPGKGRPPWALAREILAWLEPQLA
ncbi:MAG: shikimate kinase [Myxococcota bacterium]|nr:shikimate kinase [Myxococcota bacterium]